MRKHKKLIALTLGLAIVGLPDVANAGYCTSLANCIPASAWRWIFLLGLLAFIVILPEISLFLALQAEEGLLADAAAYLGRAEAIEALKLLEQSAAELSDAEKLLIESNYAKLAMPLRAQAAALEEAAALKRAAAIEGGSVLPPKLARLLTVVGGLGLANDVSRSWSGTDLAGNPITPTEQQAAARSMWADLSLSALGSAGRIAQEAGAMDWPMVWQAVERVKDFNDVVSAPKALHEIGEVLDAYGDKIYEVLKQATDTVKSPNQSPSDLWEFRTAATSLDQQLAAALTERFATIPVADPPIPTVALNGTLPLQPALERAGIPPSIQWLVDPSLLPPQLVPAGSSDLSGVVPPALTQLLRTGLSATQSAPQQAPGRA